MYVVTTRRDALTKFRQRRHRIGAPAPQKAPNS
jgi:hypothetical protein